MITRKLGGMIEKRAWLRQCPVCERASYGMAQNEFASFCGGRSVSAETPCRLSIGVAAEPRSIAQV